MSDSVFEQMSELAKMVERAAAFGHEVMRENQHLKKALRQLERKQQSWSGAAEEAHTTEQAPSPDRDLASELDILRADNDDLAQHCVRLETANDNLLNFYVASHELHSTLKVRQVLATIQEIVLNLIGADRFAIYLATKETGTLVAAESEGIEMADLPDISLEEDAIGRALAARSIFVVDDSDPTKAEVIAGVPLTSDEHIMGAILIFGLLEQKKGGFAELDHGLFALLAEHAGTALMAAQLYAASERRRETFETATRFFLETD